MSTHLPFLALEAAIALIAGLMLGIVHFRSLHRVSTAYLDGRATRAIALQVARMVAMVALLFLLAWIGALSLVAGAGGVMLARWLVMDGLERSL